MPSVAAIHMRSNTERDRACLNWAQAYERQVDMLNRALQRGEAAGTDLGQERHSLLQQLRAAEKVPPSVMPSAGFTGIFDRHPDQFCRLRDRLSDHLASHWVPPPAHALRPPWGTASRAQVLGCAA